MKKLLLLLAVVELWGCQKILGFHDTSLEPDASIDARPDGPPDAPPPPIDVGNGADGPVTVSGVTTTDGVRSALTADVGANSTLLHVTDASAFGIGDEVVIFQMTGSAAGQHETHRIASTQPAQLLLSTALHDSYGGDGIAQVIRVPNYTNVMITSGGTLTAHAWDGATGGIVFFRASGSVDVATGGTLSGDSIGFSGGSGGTPGTGGTGGGGGLGGTPTACPGLGCSLTLTNALPGLIGQVAGASMPGQPNHLVGTKCTTGKGGDGALYGTDDGIANPGNVGEGLSPAAIGTGGTNLSANASKPVLGGGGGGGDSGIGGRGAGGGGGGGGPISDKNTSNNTLPTAGGKGGDGDRGGTGGVGGDGGRGGGVVMMFAMSLSIEGTVTSSGAAGAIGGVGATGGIGGAGGTHGGAVQNCSGVFIDGEQGGAGGGGNGGTGGNGGGGGAGGVVELSAFAIAAGGTAQAAGGALGDIGSGGTGGSGGSGFGGIAPTGIDGSAGATAGTAGAAGQFFMSYVTGCTSCDAFGMPAAVVTQL